MISGAFQQFKGIGKVAEEKLHRLGISDWQKAKEDPLNLPFSKEKVESLLDEISIYQEALARNDIKYLTEGFKTLDHWRILDHYFESCSFFDIETTGLGETSRITTIGCLHRGNMYQFVRNENLDDFKDLLSEIEVLVSFNGATFDVPFIKREFRYRDIPCAHIDLRWLCKQVGLKGGLKDIEVKLDFGRPEDLEGVDGLEAVYLWYDWEMDGDRDARDRLVRYCCADVLALPLLAQEVLAKHAIQKQLFNRKELWSIL